MTPTYLGTAGWSLPRATQELFTESGSHLERYGERFRGVEINSTFYKPHRESTFARWAASVPAGFCFSVKLPRAVTHEARLAQTGPLLDEFIESLAPLAEKFSCLLVQLPPSLAYEARVARSFFAALRTRFTRDVAFEPRHASWFGPAPDKLLVEHCVARVAADPPCVPAAAQPGGWPGLAYRRLHGSPRMYYSSYDDAYLASLAAKIAEDQARADAVWCIFDNTASGAAMANLLTLDGLLATQAR